jgi:putative copper resistance protein D
MSEGGTGTRLSACIFSAALVGTLAWAGHAAATANGLGAVHIASDVLHLAAAAAWVGALLPLAVLLGAALACADPPSIGIAREVVLRFSTLGIVSVGTHGSRQPSIPRHSCG